MECTEGGGKCLPWFEALQVGQAWDGEEAVRVAAEMLPDVVRELGDTRLLSRRASIDIHDWVNYHMKFRS